MISYWSEDDSDWFFDKARRDFPNEGEVLYDIIEAMRIWGLWSPKIAQVLVFGPPIYLYVDCVTIL